MMPMKYDDGEPYIANNQLTEVKPKIFIKNEKATLIFYEAPHRLKETLGDILAIFGDRKCAVCREITKKFEEIYRGNISEIISLSDGIKGEIVIVVDGNKEIKSFNNLSIIEHVNLYVKEGYDIKEAIKKVAKERKINKNEVYKEYHNK